MYRLGKELCACIYNMCAHVYYSLLLKTPLNSMRGSEYMMFYTHPLLSSQRCVLQMSSC